MLAWRRFVFALVLPALTLAGSSVARASETIEFAQAQPQAQPTPAPSPTPTATPAPSADAQPPAVEPIGNVATVTGIATVIRDKNSYPLRVRDDIYLNDIVQTSSNSALGITFNDATTFNLSAGAKITIDNYVYDDGGKQNSAIFDVGKGTVAFVAAAVAKTGDMKITTPTATLGIRGTTGVVDVPEGAAANRARNVNIQALSRRRRPGRPHRCRGTRERRAARRADASRERLCDPSGRSHGRRHALCCRADHNSRAADRARPRLRRPGASGADCGPADRHRAARLPSRQSGCAQPHSAAGTTAAAATIAADDNPRPAAATTERPAATGQSSGSAAAGHAEPAGTTARHAAAARPAARCRPSTRTADPAAAWWTDSARRNRAAATGRDTASRSAAAIAAHRIATGPASGSTTRYAAPRRLPATPPRRATSRSTAQTRARSEGEGAAVVFLLPLWEKVARSAG
ncbi:hypothetical protein ABIE73_004828 [Bradyrhizobium yuanmingense]